MRSTTGRGVGTKGAGGPATAGCGHDRVDDVLPGDVPQGSVLPEGGGGGTQREIDPVPRVPAGPADEERQHGQHEKEDDEPGPDGPLRGPPPDRAPVLIG